VKVTTNHPASSYGVPVFLGDDGEPMTYRDGVKALRHRFGWSVAQLGEACGVSARTVEGWESIQTPRMPTVKALNVMGTLLRPRWAAKK
jgi:DNA-binding transcriptional regulator YiaG